MRFLIFLLFLFSISFAEELVVKRALDISAKIICPGDHLIIEALASNGAPADDVEIRLVRHYPYQGLVALTKTGSNGLAQIDLQKTGTYRIYIRTDEYNHEDFAEFDYPEMCPPPPAKEFDIRIEPDCNEKNLYIFVVDKGPIKGAVVTTDEWASTTGSAGTVLFPLKEGFLTIRVKADNYTDKNLTVEIDCTPPECLSDFDCDFNQYCSNETCMNITGECGYPENHSWIPYECCSDDDCGYKMLCENNTCIPEPQPIMENITPEINETIEEPVEEPQPCIAFLIPFVLIILRMNMIN